MRLVSGLLDRFYRWRAAREDALPRAWEGPMRAEGFYPAYGDWIGAFGVDTRGDVWFAEHGTSWRERELVLEPELRHAARGVAARKHPTVPFLAPTRGIDDPVCPSCAGTGYLTVLPSRMRYRFICQCGGLGWMPSGFRSWNTRPDRPSLLDRG